VTPTAPAVAASDVNLANGTPTPTTSKKSPAAGSKSKEASASKTSAASKSGLKDGTYKGAGATNPYGTVQVSIKVESGKITAVSATFPLTGNSATINPVAIPKLKQETLNAQSAKVAAVSGATYTSQSYNESLQSALDSAKA
jgi:uncharacterized protein with FMN-binding domain